MPLRYLWAGCPCRRAVRRTLRHDWMPLEHLCAYSPCRRPVISPLCHARVLLRYLWARSPCQREDLELNQNLNVHEKGSNHGQTADPNLNIHEIGSIHGQTPIRTSQSKPQFDDFYYIGENRAFLRECHIRCTESSARRHTSGDCCKMHRTSGRGGESLARKV